MVVNTYGITLRSTAGGVIGGVTGLWVTSLSAGTVYIHPVVVHIAHGAAKVDVYTARTGTGGPVEMGGAGPVGRIIGITCLVNDAAGVEQGVDGGGTAGIG